MTPLPHSDGSGDVCLYVERQPGRLLSDPEGLYGATQRAMMADF